MDSYLSWVFFKWAETIPHYNHSLQPYWTMIHILTARKQFIDAQSLLQRIAFKDFLSSALVLNALISSNNDPVLNSQILSWLVVLYAKGKKIREAIQVFEQMESNGIVPHVHACSSLLNELVKARLTDSTWKMYKRMLQIGVVPNIFVYNVMIHACCNTRDVEKAEQLLNEMELKGISPDRFSYNTLISILCRKGMHYEAWVVQERMEREGIQLDIVTYNSLIYGYCRERRMREASCLFKEIKGAIPNHVTYTTLIDGYCRVNDLTEALRLRTEMEAKGLHLGVVTYNSILRKLCEERKLRDANILLNKMGFSPSYSSYSWLIDGYCNQDNTESVLELPTEMVRRNISVDISVYRALIRRLCKREKINCAQKIFSLMQAEGIMGDAVVYTSLAYAYLKSGKPIATSEFFGEMSKRKLMITPKIYESFSASFADSNDTLRLFWDHAVERGVVTRKAIELMRQLDIK
ncbi:hypothetical protein GIB67_003590 [Kingdonia uniflora]|uniref:Pentatricopeptide repeat-containing protein n=1 Tax=Kingdonia uniflora TaxID=39325 RepID=A0A7J7MF31_9MAGN|nr:hypothetical protein GIB67_003590 [Kingdonia uniflora]